MQNGARFPSIPAKPQAENAPHFGLAKRGSVSHSIHKRKVRPILDT